MRGAVTFEVVRSRTFRFGPRFPVVRVRMRSLWPSVCDRPSPDASLSPSVCGRPSPDACSGPRPAGNSESGGTHVLETWTSAVVRDLDAHFERRARRKRSSGTRVRPKAGVRCLPSLPVSSSAYSAFLGGGALLLVPWRRQGRRRLRAAPAAQRLAVSTGPSRQLEREEMPPKSPGPVPEERLEILNWLEPELRVPAPRPPKAPRPPLRSPHPGR